MPASAAGCATNSRIPASYSLLATCSACRGWPISSQHVGTRIAFEVRLLKPVFEGVEDRQQALGGIIRPPRDFALESVPGPASSAELELETSSRPGAGRGGRNL
jgi:hypothetical protein